MPVYSGVLNYFPLAIKYISKVSYLGNEQHNPGQPLHWDRDKSQDELDALDEDGLYHDAKIAWRALANLQKLLEQK